MAVTIEFSLELTTDPLGAALDINVPSASSDDARQALLNNVERTMVGAEGNLVYQSVRRAHRQLSRYGSRHDYSTDPIEQSFAGVDYSRMQQSVHIEWYWEHDAASYFEFGTSDHTIDGEPILSFIWEDAPSAIHDMFPNTEREGGDPRVFFESVDVAGLPESRFVRNSLNHLRREVGQA